MAAVTKDADKNASNGSGTAGSKISSFLGLKKPAPIVSTGRGGAGTLLSPPVSS